MRSARSIVPSPPRTTTSSAPAGSPCASRPCCAPRRRDDQLDADPSREPTSRSTPSPTCSGRPCVTTARARSAVAQPTAASIRRSSSSGSEGSSLAIRWTTNSRFPFGPGWPESTSPATRAPQPSAASRRTREDALACTAGSRTTPRGASARPASNCGLTSTSATQSRTAQSQRRREHEGREMNETSQVDELGRERQRSSSSRALTRSSTVTRGRRGAGGELAVADVERDHARGAALEQAVGEAAGRRAEVEAVLARRVDAERVERVRELLPAARDELRRAPRPRARRPRRPAGPAWRSPGRARRARAPGPASGSRRGRARRGRRQGASSDMA